MPRTNFFISITSSQSQDLGTASQGLDEKRIDDIKFRSEFARIATGNTFTTIGNYASVSTKSETLSASIFFIADNSNVINLELSGGATQGIATIFDEGELNSNASIGLSYNLLLRKSKNAIVTNSTAEDIIKLEIEKENRGYQKKILDVLSNKYETEIKADIVKLKVIIEIEVSR